MVIYGGLSLFIYSLGIPLVLFLSLSKYRHDLNPSGFEDEARAITARMKWMRKKEILADPIINFALVSNPLPCQLGYFIALHAPSRY